MMSLGCHLDRLAAPRVSLWGTAAWIAAFRADAAL
jgi:hypothetical protein